MSDENNNKENRRFLVRSILKALLITVVILVGIAVVGLGLLVGICGLGR